MTGDDWARVKEIASAALEQDEAARPGFVAARCGADEGLRGEVLSLLDAMAQAADLFETPRFRGAETLASLIEAGDPRPSAVGTRIGAYRIIEEIGRGGMGAAYLAHRDDQAYEKRVAVKLIKRGMDTDAILRRFRHERQILARLDHPNIVMLVDGGTTTDGLPYFVMEYVDGAPIDVYCTRRHLPVTDRLKLFQQVCAAVHHAHEHRIIHRDLKPSNILVTAAGVPKLLDFGIAKLLDPEIGQHTIDPTLPGRAMTPQYASPEQARGERLTAASDVYSLGVLLYVLLAGRMPYSVDGRSAAEAERVVCEEMPPRPSSVARSDGPPATDQKTLRQQLSGDLDAIVLTALSKAPRQRYGTARALADDIQRHLDGLPTDVARHRVAPAAPRRRMWLAAAAVILAALTGTQLFDGEAPPAVAAAGPKSIAVLPLINESPDAELDYLADGVTEDIIRRLSLAPHLKVIARDSVYRYKGAAGDPLRAARELGVEAVLTGRVTHRGDRIAVTAELIDARDSRLLWAEQFDRPAGELHDLQTALAQQVAGGLRLRLSSPDRARVGRADTGSAEAYQLYLKGRYFWNKRTPSGLRSSIGYFTQAIEKDPAYARAYAGIADAQTLLTEYHDAPAADTYPQARHALARALEVGDELAEVHASQAIVRQFYEWDWASAEQEYRRALDLNPNYATARQWYAEYLSARGRHPEALAEIARAKELDPLSLIVNAVEAYLLYMAERYDESIAASLQVIAMDPNFPEVYEYLKRAYDRKGQYADAIAARQKRRALLGLDAEMTPALDAAARATTAAEYWPRRIEQELAESRREGLQPFGFAELLAQAGQTARALDWLERACSEHDFMLMYVRVAPNLAPLRAHPRYQDILRRSCRM